MSREKPSARGNRLSLAAQAGLLAGPFLSMVDGLIVNVALPDIATQLHTSLDTVQWVISGYLLALAGGLAATAYLAKRFGTRRVYLLSLVGFTLASALCALAPNVGFLIAMRAMQGALGAPLVPLAMNMLLGDEDTRAGFPPAAGIVLFLAPALGPTVGGLLIHVGGWPLIFLINVPFGIMGALGVLRIPARLSPDNGADVRFDPVGMVMLAAGLVLAIYGSTQGPEQGWSSPATWPYLVLGGVFLALYVLWALRRPHPAVDLKLLRHPQTALSVALCTLASIVMFAVLFLLPVYMENLQGLSPLVAGLALLPQGVVTGVGTVLGDWLGRRKGVRFSAALGLAILTISTVALLAMTLDTPAWVTAVILSGRGLAIGLTIQPLLLTMVSELTGDEIADGNTLFNVAERLGGSIGIPLLATFFVVREQIRLDDVPRALGIPGGASALGGGASSAHLSAALKAQLGQAAVMGFHDAIWLLITLSALGFIAALALRERAPAAENAAPQFMLASSGAAGELRIG